MKANKYFVIPMFLVVMILNYKQITLSQINSLPNSLIYNDGSPVNNSSDWFNQRRPEILKLFETHVYGKTPFKDFQSKAKILSSKLILDGKAMMNQVSYKITMDSKSIVLNLLEIRPAQLKGNIPCFVGLNFDGNQTVLADSSIKITDKWLIEYNKPEIVNNHATQASRGSENSSWPLKEIIERGYALITCCAADIDEDRLNYADGAQALFYKKGEDKPKEGEWATIGAWAWGLSRILDYIAIRSYYNSSKVIVIGHSRMGKTALWAAAQDRRFAAVISNNSGCGGAAIFRNKVGEQIADINKNFPHWFNDKFKEYNNNENALPVDQHELISLIAPRPVYVASATKDQWAGPENEFLALTMAVPVYQLLGVKGIPEFTKPLENVPQMGTLSYHIRSGYHDLTPWDWEQYLHFADKYVK